VLVFINILERKGEYCISLTYRIEEYSIIRRRSVVSFQFSETFYSEKVNTVYHSLTKRKSQETTAGNFEILIVSVP